MSRVRNRYQMIKTMTLHESGGWSSCQCRGKGLHDLTFWSQLQPGIWGRWQWLQVSHMPFPGQPRRSQRTPSMGRCSCLVWQGTGIRWCFLQPWSWSPPNPRSSLGFPWFSCHLAAYPSQDNYRPCLKLCHMDRGRRGCTIDPTTWGSFSWQGPTFGSWGQWEQEQEWWGWTTFFLLGWWGGEPTNQNQGH